MPVPTLYEWAGGADDLLAPVFAHMDEHHPHYVAMWLGEVLGGPDCYTRERGGYPHMLGKHRGLGLREERRFRWAQLMLQSADDAGLPDDPEFRSAFAAYVEWGTRLAVANSQPGAEPPAHAPVPRWGWGEAPPYQPG